MSFLLAEQNTNMALRYADFGYILENGRVVMEGAAEDLRNNEDVKEFYLGLSSQRPQELPRRQDTTAAASAGWHDRDHLDDAGNPRQPERAKLELLARLARADRACQGANCRRTIRRVARRRCRAGGGRIRAPRWRGLPVMRKTESDRTAEAAAALRRPGGDAAAGARRACFHRPARSTIRKGCGEDCWRSAGPCMRPASAPATWCTTASPTT